MIGLNTETPTTYNGRTVVVVVFRAAQVSRLRCRSRRKRCEDRISEMADMNAETCTAWPARLGVDSRFDLLNQCEIDTHIFKQGGSRRVPVMDSFRGNPPPGYLQVDFCVNQATIQILRSILTIQGFKKKNHKMMPDCSNTTSEVYACRLASVAELM